MSEKNTTKKAWVKPEITPLRNGLANKFGSVRNVNWCDSIDDVPFDKLIRSYGSPLFVASEQKLRSNIKRIKNAFSSRYPRIQMAWSYKTNYLGAICNVLHQEDAWAEVVSRFEYEKARKLGVPGQCIFFNGPNKSREILERAIDENARIHIDHLDELYLIEDIAASRNKEVNIGIRLNFDTGYTEPWSRFGFNIESGQAMDAVWRISSSTHLKLVGLHSHIGTFVLEPRAYSSQVSIMCAFLREVEGKTSFKIDYIDIGGGFASFNALQGIYLPPEQVVPSIEQYAEAICETLLEETHDHLSQGRNRPLLVLESGRAIVDDAEVLVTTVVANKRLPDGRRAVVLDAGVNLLFTAYWYNHVVRPTKPLDGKPEETVLYGPLCMNIDVMRNSVILPPLSVGDQLVFSSVGAYNNTQWQQFIEYRPNVVMVHNNGGVSVIRTAENLETMTAHEKLPEHLSRPFPDDQPEK